NNPAMCAYSEARTIDFAAHYNDALKNSFPTSQDMFLLSIGTGEEKEPFLYEEAKDWGLVGWLQPLLDILMSANSETVDYQLRQMFNTTEPGNYVRMQPDLFHANSQMDNATQANMLALKDAAQKFVIEHKAKLNAVVQKLIENKTIIKKATT
ncbi:MAG TPA: patatin, partial [Bacteroidales bacterium]|nr:patatin [Bacteroidales bacterium]